MLPDKSQDAMPPREEIPIVHAIGSIQLAVKLSIPAERSVESRCAYKA